MNVHQHILKRAKKILRKNIKDDLFGNGHSKKGRSKCPTCSRPYLGKYNVCNICAYKQRRKDSCGIKELLIQDTSDLGC